MTRELTREQAEDTIQGLEGLISRGVQSVYLDMAIAGMRQLLAAMDSEPVAWTWQHLDQWHVTNDEERARDLAWDGVNVEPLYRHAQPVLEIESEPVFTLEVARADYKGQKLGNHFGFITLDAARELKEGNYQLYTAQPVTVVPDELKEAAADFLTVLDEYPEQLVPINRDSAVVRALRAAMLNQAPVKQPSSKPKSELLQRAEKLAEDTAALVERVGGATCAWGSDDSGTWIGSCGAEWQFFDDGPVENSMNFCPGCGKPVSVK